MLRGMLDFIGSSGLSAFLEPEAHKAPEFLDIYSTREGRAVAQKALSILSGDFCFSASREIWAFFGAFPEKRGLAEKQAFFSGIPARSDRDFLRSIRTPKPIWKPKYSVMAATEDEKTYAELKRLGVPVTLVCSEHDVESLDDYELVQAIDCENYVQHIERLSQSVFLKGMEQVYPERHLIRLSGWAENLRLVFDNMDRIGRCSRELGELAAKEIDVLIPLLELIKEGGVERDISAEEIAEATQDMNMRIGERLKLLTLSGDQLVSILSGKSLPPDIDRAIRDEIRASGLPPELFNVGLPLTADAQAVESYVFRHRSERFTTFAEKVKKRSGEISQIPDSLLRLDAILLAFDFLSGVSQYIDADKKSPSIGSSISIVKSRNIFLDRPEPVTFMIGADFSCSILTGANSGGKTTLLEHIIQLTCLAYLGLPADGEVSLPIFGAVYYFAKNKGATGKGAFENLLTQMSRVKVGQSKEHRTLILADEIEAVTEPGAAGKIICATASYFLEKGSILVIATHLGQEIQGILPKGCRIDGIQAKGLDDNFELIVDHNPVMGKLAASTPELIISRLAKSKKGEYFEFLDRWANAK